MLISRYIVSEISTVFKESKMTVTGTRQQLLINPTRRWSTHLRKMGLGLITAITPIREGYAASWATCHSNGEAGGAQKVQC